MGTAAFTGLTLRKARLTGMPLMLGMTVVVLTALHHALMMVGSRNRQ